MTREETLKILSVLKAAYPAFYSKISGKDGEGVANLWTSMFTEEPYPVVSCAITQLISTHTGYPPDIAAVKGAIRDMISAVTCEPTDEELWLLYKNAVKNYNPYALGDTWDSLLPILKSYAGTPGTLLEHGMLNTDTFVSVIHGQFLRQIPALRKRSEFTHTLPANVLSYLRECNGKQTALPPPG